jgi:hypothetical protein
MQEVTRKWPKGSAVVLAVACASIAAAFQLTILELVRPDTKIAGGVTEWFIFVGATFVMILMSALVFSVILGLPIFLAFQGAGLTGWWTPLLAGPAIGLLVCILFRGFNHLKLGETAILVTVATVSSVIFRGLLQRGSAKHTTKT